MLDLKGGSKPSIAEIVEAIKENRRAGQDVAVKLYRILGYDYNPKKDEVVKDGSGVIAELDELKSEVRLLKEDNKSLRSELANKIDINAPRRLAESLKFWIPLATSTITFLSVMYMSNTREVPAPRAKDTTEQIDRTKTLIETEEVLEEHTPKSHLL